MTAVKVTTFLPEVLQAGRDLQRVELAPLLLQQAQTVVVTAIVLKPRARVVAEIGFIKIRAVRACQSLPSCNFILNLIFLQ